MKKLLADKSIQLALASIACPLLAVAIVLLYQKIAHQDFWQNLEMKPDPDNAHVAALMIISEAIQLFFWTGIACLFGFLLAVLSARKQRKLFGAATIALLLNGLPLTFFLFFFGRAWLRGNY